MPYIKREDRRRYRELVEQLADRIPDDRVARPGHLNYVVSLLIDRVYGTAMRYADHNEPLGMLTAVALELYRRKTAPYEDRKIADEGDLHEA